MTIKKKIIKIEDEIIKEIDKTELGKDINESINSIYDHDELKDRDPIDINEGDNDG